LPKIFSKTAVTSLIYDSMFVNSYCTTLLLWSCFCACFTNQTFASQWIFNLKSHLNLKESSFQCWCNEKLNNCMSSKKQTRCISCCNWNTGIGIWNETPQLIFQYSIVPSKQFKIVMQAAQFFCIFTKWPALSKPVTYNKIIYMRQLQSEVKDNLGPQVNYFSGRNETTHVET